jgi:hypothetical protein
MGWRLDRQGQAIASLRRRSGTQSENSVKTADAINVIHACGPVVVVVGIDCFVSSCNI